MEYSDFELVRGIKNGDKSALDILVRRWYPHIYRYVFKLVAHEQDAYDITQDVFIAVMQNIKSYLPWKKFDGWIFTIAHNKCMDHFRMQKRIGSENTIEFDHLSSVPSFDEAVTLSVAVKDALRHLPAVQREAIILHYFQQFTAKEISHMTNTPLPTIKSRLSTAKKTLFKYLREDFQ